MATQLTLISVPVPPEPTESDPMAGSIPTTSAAPHPATSITAPAAPGVARPSRSAGATRSSSPTGWLDRRTITSGRRGVAAARAALADANQRVAEREAALDADRHDDLARHADDVARSRHTTPAVSPRGTGAHAA